MADKTGIAASVLSSAVISALISGAFGHFGDQRLEKYKLDLQNKNAVLTKKVNAYSSLNDKMRMLAASLSKYSQLCQLAAKNGGDKMLRLAASQTMNEATDLMGDINEAIFKAIDKDTKKRVDDVVRPISLNFHDAQREPAKNPNFTKLYQTQLKQQLEEIEKEIDTR